MKNIFRKRTETEIEELKEYYLHMALDILKIMIVNVIATWMAVLVVTIIFGPKAMKMGRLPKS